MSKALLEVLKEGIIYVLSFGLLGNETRDVDTQENLSEEDPSSIDDMLTEEELLKVRAYKANLDVHGFNEVINEIFGRNRIDPLDFYVWAVTEGSWEKVNREKALQQGAYRDIKFEVGVSMALNISVGDWGIYLIESKIFEKFHKTLEQDKKYLTDLISSTGMVTEEELLKSFVADEYVGVYYGLK